MRRIPLRVLVDNLAPVARPIMLQYFISTCCIATCRVLSRVFAHYGYRAEPIPVAAMLFNERMLLALSRNEVPPSARNGSDPFTRAVSKDIDFLKWCDLTGAWGIGIVPESADISRANGYDGFGGHLVLRVRDLMVDASIAQASRPEKGIDVPMMVATTATPEFLRGHPLVVDLGRGMLRYTRINDTSFYTAPDWRKRENMLGPLNEILKRLREFELIQRSKERDASSV